MGLEFPSRTLAIKGEGHTFLQITISSGWADIILVESLWIVTAGAYCFMVVKHPVDGQTVGEMQSLKP